MAGRPPFLIDDMGEQIQFPRSGWFRIKGFQEGIRTFEEQSAGLTKAFEECRGKTVLDLGCAEGLISHEFARRGADWVQGLESNLQHVAVARYLGAGLPCTFIGVNLNHVVVADPVAQFDIVCALAVIHKMQDIELALRWSARACKDLLVIRRGEKYHAGVMKSKRIHAGPVVVADVLHEEGFVLESVAWPPGIHAGEGIEYWRRTR